VLPPAGDLELVRGAHRRVLQSIDDLTDAQAAEPSRLPGWTRAEVITHLARNADGIRNMVEGAARGEVAAMYPGGAEQRAAGIAAGRGERAANLRTDLRKACDRLTESWQTLPDDAWDRVGMTSIKRPVRELPWVRLRETEVHHADLAVGYEPTDWPVRFISGAFREIFDTFPQRSSNRRPLVDAEYLIVSTDHERAWRVALRGNGVAVEENPTDDGNDGEARGWGCDLVAWLYGRDPRGGGIVASGDPSVLRLPQWFPFS
jgi:uncharacterized protein (TIGR03083 family)